MANITSRPAASSFSGNLNGTLSTSGRSLLDAITAANIWGTTSLQYHVGVTGAESWDPEFGSSYNPRYSGPADATNAFASEIRAAFRAIDAVVSLDFSELTSTTSAQASAEFILVSSDDSISATLEGFHQFPGSSQRATNDYWSIGAFTSDLSAMTASPETGGSEYSNWTVIHEIGHGLGLLHPHGGSGTLAEVGTALDNERYTVMSYHGATAANTYGHALTPMVLDIAALQAIYGTESANTSNTSSYTLLDAQQRAVRTNSNDVEIGRAYYAIWDSAGNADTIDYAGTANSVLINLNDGTLNRSSVATDAAASITALQHTAFYGNLASSIRTAIVDPNYHAGGFFSQVLTQSGSTYNAIDGGFAIAFGAQIENATGGAHEDLLIGNELANVLTGNGGNDTLIGSGGNDTINGGAGTDIAAFSGARSEYTITAFGSVANQYVVTHTGGSTVDGRDVLINVEQARFSDQVVDLSTVSAESSLDLGLPVDFIFLQDLTGSFSDDLPVVEGSISDILTGLEDTLSDVQFGVTVFRDQGDEFVYQVRSPVSSSRTAVENAYAAMVAAAGGDYPEAQLTALLNASSGSGLSFRPESQRVFMVLTDASFHDYHTTAQIRAALDAANASVIFAVTAGERATYEALALELGDAAVVTLTNDSSNFADAVRGALQILSGEIDIIGTDGDDTLTGTDGAGESIFGGLGDDVIEGRGGDDRIDGGGGSDILGGGDGNDRVIGGSGVDTLYGDSGDDIVEGLGGNDILYGDGGDLVPLPTGNGLANNSSTVAVPTSIASGARAVRMDTGFSLSASNNIINSTTVPHMTATRTATTGGENHYYVMTIAAGTTVTFDVDYAYGGTDSFDGYLTVYNASGTIVFDNDDATDPTAGSTGSRDPYYSYTFATGGTYFIKVNGYPGSSLIPAGSTYQLHVSVESSGRPAAADPGNDILRGGDGDDNLFGGEGRDLLEGGAGADALNGGSGGDTADYSNSDGRVNISLLSGYASGGHAAGDTFDSIENLIGTRFDDRLVGNNGNNALQGMAGADVLMGNGGEDTASYLLSNEAVNISLASGYVAGGHAAGDTFYSIENLTGSAFDDRLSGDARSQALTGSFGDDTLLGRGGADRLYGGDGSDTASYSDAPDAVNVSLATGYTSGSHAAGDTFSSIENLIGTRFDDRLNGDSGRNILEGGAGADYLNGYQELDLVSYAGSSAAVNVSLLTGYVAGGDAVGDTFVSIEGFIGSRFDDTLNGSNGNNVLEGGLGADILRGNGGNDTASYIHASSAVNVSLATGYTAGAHAAGDRFFSIENLTGSAFDDQLSGDGRSQALTGSFGDDLLRGRGGADRLYGGDGSDTASYSDASGAVNVSLLTGYAAGSDAVGDTFSSIENLDGSRFDDRLSGDNGNNILEGRAGSDALVGNGGSDTASYAGSNAGVTVSLATGYASGGHATGDSFQSIENLLGSGFNDELSGSSGVNNILMGGAGNDVLRGRGGADTLNGGSGTDIANYDDASGQVNVSLASGYTGGAHAQGDVFISIEGLTGSNYNDRLTGNSGANILDGGPGGNDILAGYGGADRFVFRAGFDQDTISDFQDGTDILDFSGNSQVNSISDVTIGTSGADATVSDGFGNTITILNAAGLIAADDFDFV